MKLLLSTSQKVYKFHITFSLRFHTNALKELKIRENKIQKIFRKISLLNYFNN